ncbi:MAG: hypothetical protein OXF26_12350 [Alphaproteobacteria bacterium]|nr:hypothetical protein [Alphaproteobacteria bacterium]MCY4318927.1 hypothetical protein [Alphaproteobacteria bacterium]
MAEVTTFAPGGYRYIRGQFQYSGGVAAEPGYRIERVRFHRLVPLEAGFRRIEAFLEAARRPMTAFCACELRSPGQFSEEGFAAFNRAYVGTLERWSIFRDEENPVARSNVCPDVNPPAEPGFHAFCYTVPDDGEQGKTFIIAGAGEAPEGPAPYRDRIIRLGDTSPDAMREKARYVLGAMESRMAALGFGWPDATASQVYTVHEIHGLLGSQIVARGGAPDGIQWTYAHPPVEGLAYEMDVRGVFTERVVV